MVRQSQTVRTSNGATVREVERSAWSPAQAVAVVVGIVLVVLGGVGLARAGTNFSNIAVTHVTVVGLSLTSLSAAALIALGVIVLAGGAYPSTAKATMGAFGAALIAFGLIVALDPKPFANLWGLGTGNGIFLAVVGAILLFSAAASPSFSARRQVVRQEQDVVQPDVAPADPDVVVVGSHRRADDEQVSSSANGY